MTYGNIQDADGRRHGDGDAIVYANIQPSPTPAAEFQYNNQAAQGVVYSELQSP